MRGFDSLAVVFVAIVLGGCQGMALTFYEENDNLRPGGAEDGYYTQGARISLVLPATSLPRSVQEACASLPCETKQPEEELDRVVGFVLGQQIYTPRDITIEAPQPDDRPWAGWLYLGLVFATRSVKNLDPADDHQHTWEVDVGVVGPSSLAEQTQTRYHDLTDSAEPQGWDNQLEDEPGLDVTYERRFRLASWELPLCTGADLIPAYGATLGTVHTHAAVGGTARFGFNLPRDFGVNTISTTAMETASSGESDYPSLYLFGSAEGRGVLRNEFLDGSFFHEGGPSVEKDHLVGEFRAGLALQYKALRLTYTLITRSPEFHGQDGWTKYGSVSLGLFLDF